MRWIPAHSSPCISVFMRWRFHRSVTGTAPMLAPSTRSQREVSVMTASDSPEVPPVRASDADRQAVVAVLHDAFTRGLLTMEECDERMAAAYSARFVRGLPPLTAHLPPAPAAA